MQQEEDLQPPEVSNQVLDGEPGSQIVNDLIINKGLKINQTQSWRKLSCIAFQLIFYAVAVYSFAWGNPSLLGQPYDIDQTPCGAGVGMEDYKFAYFVNPDSKDQLYRTLCVKSCPKVANKQQERDDSVSLECHPNLKITSCDVRVQPGHPEYTLLYYDTVPFINVCVPTDKARLQNVMPALQKPEIVRILSDFHHSNVAFISITFLALFLNFLIIYKIDDYPRGVIWLTNLFAILGFFANAGLGFLFIQQIEQNSDIIQQEQQLTQDEIIGYIHSNYVHTKILLIVSGVFAVFGLLAVIFAIIKRKDISTCGKKAEIINNFLLATQREDQDDQSNYLAATLRVFLVLSVGLAVFSLFMIEIASYLFSSSPPKNDDFLLAFQFFQVDIVAQLCSIIILLEFLFVPLLIIGFSKLLVINVIIEIYKKKVYEIEISQNQQDKPRTVVESIGMAFRFHFDVLLEGFTNILICFFRKQIITNGFRSFNLVCLKNQSFEESAQNQYNFDQYLSGKNRKNYNGLNYQFIVSCAVSNMCVSYMFLCLNYSPIKNAIHNPSYLIIFIYLFSFMISYLFSTLYGTGMDTLMSLLYRDVEFFEQQRVVGIHVQSQFRMIALAEFGLEGQQEIQQTDFLNKFT